MHFDLVSPERRLASMDATAVMIPGADGDMTVMADHAPVISTLRPGILKVEAEAGGSQDYVVTGGFAEVTAEAVTVLAELAVPVSEATSEMIDGMLSSAREAAGKVDGPARDKANKQIADLEAVKVAAGL